MKKLIFQKFLKDLITFFLLVSLSIALIVWVIQAVNFLDFISEDGHGFKVYFYYTVLNLPKIFSRILPFIFFVSLFYTILKYENNNELIIFWTTGIKKIQFTNTMIKFSIFFLLIQLILTAFIVPKSQDLASSVKFFLYQDHRHQNVFHYKENKLHHLVVSNAGKDTDSCLLG